MRRCVGPVGWWHTQRKQHKKSKKCGMRPLKIPEKRLCPVVIFFTVESVGSSNTTDDDSTRPHTPQRSVITFPFPHSQIVTKFKKNPSLFTTESLFHRPPLPPPSSKFLPTALSCRGSFAVFCGCGIDQRYFNQQAAAAAAAGGARGGGGRCESKSGYASRKSACSKSFNPQQLSHSASHVDDC